MSIHIDNARFNILWNKKMIIMIMNSTFSLYILIVHGLEQELWYKNITSKRYPHYAGLFLYLQSEI